MAWEKCQLFRMLFEFYVLQLIFKMTADRTKRFGAWNSSFSTAVKLFKILLMLLFAIQMAFWH